MAFALYISPDGNDAWQGTKDRPLATLAAARDALRNRQEKNVPVIVNLRAGTYNLHSTFELHAEIAAQKARKSSTERIRAKKCA